MEHTHNARTMLSILWLTCPNLTTISPHDQLQAPDKDEICLEKVKLDSEMKPRLWAESVWVIGGFEGREREGLEILDIC